MSSITPEDIDDFMDYLSLKPCKGAKSYNKRPDEIPTLSSSSVKKCYTVLTSGFETALKWHYIGFNENITPRRFRTTVLTDLYDMTKDIKQAQAAAGHTTAAMTLKHYVKGRSEHRNTAAPIASAYGLEN